MIKKWFQMKKKEIEMKLRFYTIIKDFIDSKQDIIDKGRKLISDMINTPDDELQKIFVNKLSEIIHEEGNKEREIEKAVDNG